MASKKCLVWWGGFWIEAECRAIGQKHLRGQVVKARVYDPHAREWVWQEFTQNYWRHIEE